MTIQTAYYQSPVGVLELKSLFDTLIGLDFLETPHPNLPFRENLQGEPPKGGKELDKRSSILEQTIQELDEYFAGKRTTFTVPIHQEGTAFQVSVWSALRTIPFGQTRSYQDIATQIKNPKAVRAVGMTNGKNPIAIIVPCHRVIGKNGKMVGYSSGVWRKEWLLAHEKKMQ